MSGAEAEPVDLPKPARKAGLLEKFHIVRGHLGADTGVFVTAQYVGEGRLDKHTLYPALTLLLQQHRALSTQVHDAGTEQPFYVSLKIVDLSRIVRFYDADSKQLSEVAESYLLDQIEYATDTPLWRLGVFPDNRVIIHYDHSIGDGQSGLAFHRSLLTALNSTSPSQDEPSSVVPIPESLELQPTVEKATDVSLSFFKICQEIFNAFAPIRWRKAGSSWTGEEVTRQETMFTSTRLWSLPPEQADSLLKICRLHECTITSFLHTATVMVFSTLLRDSPKRYKYLASDIPISLRRFTKAPADVFCDHVSAGYFFSPITRYPPELVDDFEALAKRFPWEDAARTTSDLRKKVPKCRQEVGTLNLLFGRYQPFFRGKIGKKRHGTFELSNVGPFPFDKSDNEAGRKWKVGEMFFGQCDALLGATIKLDDVLAQFFVDHFRSLVEAILKQAQ
ncbi:unnamed protein product [Somion occarium]|uniref:Alcohol acetyltransferase n=1 Tax=Somion occarium TaxID=3059160 RepID=A0ABP1E486_9APHY